MNSSHAISGEIIEKYAAHQINLTFSHISLVLVSIVADIEMHLSDVQNFLQERTCGLQLLTLSGWPQLLSSGHAFLGLASPNDQARCASGLRLLPNVRLFE